MTRDPANQKTVIRLDLNEAETSLMRTEVMQIWGLDAL